MLQTRNPQHPVFRYVLAHDYDGFAQVMMDERRTFHYPPYGRIVGVEFRGLEEEQVDQIARRWMWVLSGCWRALALGQVEAGIMTP